MKKAYGLFCWLENVVANLLLLAIMVLVFVSAVSRFFDAPLNWAQDVCLVAFTWMIFLGADIAIRGPGFIGIDLFIKHLPKSVQKGLDILFKIVIIGFLCMLVYNGGIAVSTSSAWARRITTLGISYAWVTMAVPVGSFLMIISTLTRLVESIKKPAKNWGVKA